MDDSVSQLHRVTVRRLGIFRNSHQYFKQFAVFTREGIVTFYIYTVCVVFQRRDLCVMPHGTTCYADVIAIYNKTFGELHVYLHLFYLNRVFEINRISQLLAADSVFCHTIYINAIVSRLTRFGGAAWIVIIAKIGSEGLVALRHSVVERLLRRYHFAILVCPVLECVPLIAIRTQINR